MLIDFLVFFLCFFSQVCWLFVVEYYKKKWFNIGQIWGNLISYFILKPEEKESNGTFSNEIEKYDKCGAEFTEKEYKGAEVINHIERRTVWMKKFHFFLLLFYVILDWYSLYHLYMYLCMFNINYNYFS